MLSATITGAPPLLGIAAGSRSHNSKRSDAAIILTDSVPASILNPIIPYQGLQNLNCASKETEFPSIFIFLAFVIIGYPEMPGKKLWPGNAVAKRSESGLDVRGR